MNILIIEDDEMKKDYLYLQLREMDSNNRIRWFNNYQDATLFISDNAKYIDLIMLDWSFPHNSYSRPMYGMGRQLLSFMKLNNMNINVIISSSDMISLNDTTYPFVLGSIDLNSDTPFSEQLDDLINPQHEKEDIARVLKPKKPNTDTGYKRRKSSQPWWQK